jgi:hypothetical protein
LLRGGRDFFGRGNVGHGGGMSSRSVHGLTLLIPHILNLTVAAKIKSPDFPF